MISIIQTKKKAFYFKSDCPLCPCPSYPSFTVQLAGQIVDKNCKNKRSNCKRYTVKYNCPWGPALACGYTGLVGRWSASRSLVVVFIFQEDVDAHVLSLGRFAARQIWWLHPDEGRQSEKTQSTTNTSRRPFVRTICTRTHSDYFYRNG